MQSGLAGQNLGECFNPPRCGGLLCNAPKGAEEKLPILRYVLPTFLPTVRNMS
ncbi:MAG: hypothetical protein LBL62_09780 [Planctomycetaceae bacterium]|nr:hypothetical protein [Planctomycetaceae bacterium]